MLRYGGASSRSATAGGEHYVMKFARFWAKERAEVSDGKQSISVLSRGWSDDSLDAAVRVARQNADRLARLILSGSSKQKRYFYGERPIPEPVVEEIHDRNRKISAAITRNRYGALVINSSNGMFIDVDRPHRMEGGGVSGILKSLFKGKQPAESQDRFVSEVRRILEGEPQLGVRVYRTKGGYRLLVTSKDVAPDSAESIRLFDLFGADPLYRKLCALQKSFRARLTPKPWRCGLQNPPVSFPFRDSVEKGKFDRWLTSYNAACNDFATCELLGSFGNNRVTAEAQTIYEWHDRFCNVNSGKPLA